MRKTRGLDQCSITGGPHKFLLPSRAGKWAGMYKCQACEAHFNIVQVKQHDTEWAQQVGAVEFKRLSTPQ